MNDLNTVWSTSDLIAAGLAYTVMGVLIVFSILIIIMLVIKAMALFSGEKKQKPVKGEVPAVTAPAEEVQVAKTDDSELVAVITAAIAAMMNENTSDFVVRSYKKIPGDAWNKAGRREMIENRI